MLILSEKWKMRPKHNWYSKLIRKYYKFRRNMVMPAKPIRDEDILEKVEKEKQLVIQVPYGGLGDHLMYSSLPELLWKQKQIKTFVSNGSIYRSEAIQKFVWELNPYVTFTDRKGWFIHKPVRDDFTVLDEYLQDLFGIEGEGHPKIYYTPNLIEQIKGKTIVDASCGASGKANGYFEPDFYKRFLEYLKNNVDDFILITHQHSGTKDKLQELIKATFAPPCYNVSTIEQLANVLFSASKRLLLYSGAASLAAALGKTSHILCYKKAVPTFQYKINEYIDLVR